MGSKGMERHDAKDGVLGAEKRLNACGIMPRYHPVTVVVSIDVHEAGVLPVSGDETVVEPPLVEQFRIAEREVIYLWTNLGLRRGTEEFDDCIVARPNPRVVNDLLHKPLPTEVILRDALRWPRCLASEKFAEKAQRRRQTIALK